MIVIFACQTLFIWNITVTSKFDSTFNHPESKHRVSNMPVWVIRKVHNLLYLVHWYCTRRYVRYNALILEQKPYKILRYLVSPCSSGSDWRSESDIVPCGNVTATTTTT